MMPLVNTKIIIQHQYYEQNKGNIIKKRLFDLNEINAKKIKKILNENEVIVLTKSQAKILDGIYKNTIPRFGDYVVWPYMQPRYKIQIIFNSLLKTIENCLFKIK